MALYFMDFGLRFEEPFIKRFVLGGFITGIGSALLLALKNELQNNIQQSSIYLIVLIALISVSTSASGLFVLCYRSCIDIDANLKIIRLRKGIFLPFVIRNEYDFSVLESLILSKEHDSDYELDLKGNLRSVYSIKIQTHSGELIGLDTFFDAEKALSIASRISELTKLEIKRQNATLSAPWWLNGCYRRNSKP